MSAERMEKKKTFPALELSNFGVEKQALTERKMPELYSIQGLQVSLQFYSGRI
jgi:hypothetical protein